jgi:hypothetical protein
VDARALWVPAPDGAWRLRGASLAVWGGEVVCVAGPDAEALGALLACLRGAPPWGGVLRARGGWWRLGHVADPLDARGRPARWVARRLLALAQRRPVGGALVGALVLDGGADGWAALRDASTAATPRVPLRCVALVAGRVAPPPFR